jgi:hypothetical protein
MVMPIFAPTFASSIASNPDLQVKCFLHVAKRNATHSQSELQLTYEEREKEEESCGQQKSKQAFINTFADFSTFAGASFTNTSFSFLHTRLIPLYAHLYLVRRSLRI